MSSCPSIVGDTALSLAGSLKTLDCRTGEVTANVFGRLFGPEGHLLPALTIMLTLYVALFAIALLGGRTKLGIGALTPRMMTLGLVLTFATSWTAYQNVVWTLATGAPDEIARVVSGTNGSATAEFADRLDGLFATVADSADQASRPAPATETGVTPATPMVGGFTASTVLWLSALMLLLGSVGVLVTAKIALAALLALGPLFIVMALFEGTRGLFEGWLKAVVLFALAPVFAVLVGSGAIATLEPIAAALVQSGEEPSSRLAGAMFVGSAVFVALMVMALRAATIIVSGWRLPGSIASKSARGGHVERNVVAARQHAGVPVPAAQIAAGPAVVDARIRDVIAAARTPREIAGEPLRSPAFPSRRLVDPRMGSSLPQAANRNDPRTAEVGRRFRPPAPPTSREKIS